MRPEYRSRINSQSGVQSLEVEYVEEIGDDLPKADNGQTIRSSLRSLTKRVGDRVLPVKNEGGPASVPNPPDE